ncbi:peptidase inhibitor family I36 protein [Streptomyces sp. NPDC014006]|uniref:peptidase inhibitor family I36 protein n=1 Tax=Streptomyces sp. NPDC014006 TaxID=3364870 RepID=UPI003702CB4E
MNKLSTRSAVLAALLAVLGAFATYLALPAKADSWQGCAAGQLCLYTEAGGAGTPWATGPADATQTYDTAHDNVAVSVWNNTAYWACLYDGTSYGGVMQAIKPGVHTDLSRTTADLTGKVSSHKLAKSKAGCWTGFERCPDHTLCLFQEPSGRGVGTVSTADNPDYGPTWDNRVVSVWNRTDRHLCFYDTPGYKGSWTADGRAYKAYVVLSGSSTTVPAPYAGTFGSHKFVTGTSEC